jgi:hypothetical protein
MWVPSMLSVMGDRGSLPTGLVFASFMLAMSIGGLLFGLFLPLVLGGPEVLCAVVYLLSAVAMAVPVFQFSFWHVYFSFLALECLLGMFNSCGATLRSRYYPENVQSTIMSLFRIPLNLIVVMGTLMTSNAKNDNDLQGVFRVLVTLHLIATLLQTTLCYYVFTSSSHKIDVKMKQE